MRRRYFSFIPIVAQIGWLADLVWLVSVNSKCQRACDLNAISYWFWGGIEALLLPFVILGAFVLLRR